MLTICFSLVQFLAQLSQRICEVSLRTEVGMQRHQVSRHLQKEIAGAIEWLRLCVRRIQSQATQGIIERLQSPMPQGLQLRWIHLQHQNRVVLQDGPCFDLAKGLRRNQVSVRQTLDR